MSEFDRRYRSAFGDRLWYAEVRHQWEEDDSDDDTLCQSIDRMLSEMAAACGIHLANQQCGRCSCDLPEAGGYADDWYGRLCFSCQEIQTEEREAEQWWAMEDAIRFWRLSPAERARELAEAGEVLRIFTHGLVARDVQ